MHARSLPPEGPKCDLENSTMKMEMCPLALSRLAAFSGYPRVVFVAFDGDGGRILVMWARALVDGMRSLESGGRRVRLCYLI